MTTPAKKTTRKAAATESGQHDREEDRGPQDSGEEGREDRREEDRGPQGRGEEGREDCREEDGGPQDSCEEGGKTAAKKTRSARRLRRRPPRRTARKTAAKKTAAKKTTATKRGRPAKKTTARKTAAKKTTGTRAAGPAKKTTARKTAAKAPRQAHRGEEDRCRKRRTLMVAPGRRCTARLRRIADGVGGHRRFCVRRARRGPTTRRRRSTARRGRDRHPVGHRRSGRQPRSRSGRAHRRRGRRLPGQLCDRRRRRVRDARLAARPRRARRGETLYFPDLRVPLHPPVLSEGAASLLPGQVRPAVLWRITLDADGEVPRRRRAPRAGAQPRAARLRRRAARCRCRHARRMPWRCCREVGDVRLALARDGTRSISTCPRKRSSRTARGWQLIALRTAARGGATTPRSRCSPACAPRDIMLDHRHGILRTVPPPDTGRGRARCAAPHSRSASTGRTAPRPATCSLASTAPTRSTSR